VPPDKTAAIVAEETQGLAASVSVSWRWGRLSVLNLRRVRRAIRGACRTEEPQRYTGRTAAGVVPTTRASRSAVKS
jgi:hypothetical protein